jgi:hypothetical protein
MWKRIAVPWIASLAACAGAPPSGPARESWLKPADAEKFHQIESQLRGFDITMMEVGYRFTELYWAGQDRNWAYAKYQAEKIGHVIRLGIERRPKRAASAQPFLSEEVPAILQAVEKKTVPDFQAGIERLRASCMRCHVLEKLPDFTLEFPEHRMSPIRKVP